MKIAVIGLWHLGCVTAACLANAGHDVIAYDPNEDTIKLLQSGKVPLFEPGLDALITQNRQSGKLHVSSALSDLAQADIAWITFDTPVDENDIADVESTITQITNIFPYLQNNALVLISSQLPVGSTRKLLQECTQQFPNKKITFACSPENLRLGKAIDVFTHPDRVIVGLQSMTDAFIQLKITQLFKPFTENIVWMSLESAEMTKHALNAFLATSVVFINELSTLCEQVGANAADVEMGLKTEERIGKKAYLRPGNAIAGGTLARDVNYLIGMGHEKSLETPLFSALLKSNHAHKQWSCRRIIDILKDLKNKTITTLGLTYKVGTDTLRRSTAVETCQWLAQQGAKVLAYDPAIQQLPQHLASIIELKSTLEDAIENSDAVIIATEWPEFATLSIDQLLKKTIPPCIFDAGGFLAKNLGQDKRIRYFSVGREA
jgi:UDPglucose 6-dehydrogenase